MSHKTDTNQPQNSSHAPILLISILMLFFITGCTPYGMNPSHPQGKIPLKLWYWNRSIDDALLQRVNTVFPHIKLEAIKISDYDNKVRTAMAARHGVPDLLGINSNIATYFPDEDEFIDLKTLGANSLKSTYLPWKWDLTITPGQRQIALPMDTGPTALFYRADIFARAGLPTEPDQVAAHINNWDDFLQAGQQLKHATQGKSYVLDSINSLFTQMLAQHPHRYFDRQGNYIGDQSHLKQIWDTAVKAHHLGISGQVPPGSQTWHQAVSNGRVAAFVGAVWMKNTLQDAAPDTAGSWRIARAPGGDGNHGGSFLALTKYCKYPREAFAVMKWLLSATNQANTYQTTQLFPSALHALDNPQIHQPEAFFGGQNTTHIFAQAVKHIPNCYMSPEDGTVSTSFTDQLNLIEYQQKDPEQAWLDTQARIQRELLR